MSLYQMNNDKNLLDKFIRESQGKEKRDLSRNEKAFLEMLVTRKKNGFRLGSTLRAYMVMLRRFQEDYNDVITNLCYASKSIDKQSGYTGILIGAMERMKPDKKTVDALNRYATKYRKRQEWIKKTSIAAAVELTPVGDYIEMVGEDRFEKELRFATRDRNDEHMGRFIDLMMRELKKAGLENEYKIRLDKYRGRSTEIQKITEEDKKKEKEEKTDKDHNDAETLMFKCSSKLYDDMQIFKDDEKLGFNMKSYTRKRDACTEPSGVVLVGKIYGKQFNLRYLRFYNGKDMLMKSIGSAVVFPLKECEAEAKKYVERHPEQAAMCLRIV